MVKKHLKPKNCSIANNHFTWIVFKFTRILFLRIGLVALFRKKTIPIINNVKGFLTSAFHQTIFFNFATTAKFKPQQYSQNWDNFRRSRNVISQKDQQLLQYLHDPLLVTIKDIIFFSCQLNDVILSMVWEAPACPSFEEFSSNCLLSEFYKKVFIDSHY